MLKMVIKGKYKKAKKYFNNVLDAITLRQLDKYGAQGVEALEKATPEDTGLTAKSWHYRIIRTIEGANINFYNTNIQNGVQIAIILQYGHATRDGGWVEGRDYIYPAIRPVFDKLADDAWEEVKNSAKK